MARRARLGWLLVVAGIGIAALSLTVGGSTARACPGLGGVVYETVGVHPGGIELVGVDLADATVEWDDGCNWRTNSVLPLVVGLPVTVGGLVIVVRQRTADA